MKIFHPCLGMALGSPILTASFASDPTKWEGIFEQSWHVAEAVMERKVIDVEHDITYDEVHFSTSLRLSFATYISRFFQI